MQRSRSIAIAHKALLAGGLIVTLLAPRLAGAERRNVLSGKPAVRHKVELRKLRLEITPEFFGSINQDYRNAFGPGATIEFHILDWLGVGVTGMYAFNSNTPLENRVRRSLPDENAGMGYVYPGPQPTLQMHDERILNFNAAAAGFISITPWWGKFSLFSALFLNYDFYVRLGAGMVYYTQSGCCKHVQTAPGTIPDSNLENPAIYAGVRAAGYVGFGSHLYFTDWLGLELELRDYITNANPGGADVNADRHLTDADEKIQNNLFFGFGLNFMLPPRAKISD